MRTSAFLMPFFIIGVVLAREPGAKGTARIVFEPKIKVESEYRDNILRALDSLKLDDYRLNLYVGANLSLSSELLGNPSINYNHRLYRYGEFDRYNRYEHLVNASLLKSYGAITRLSINDEFRTRNYPEYSTWAYRRNILEGNLHFLLPRLLTPAIGFQSWHKEYPHNEGLSDYSSNRFYFRLAGLYKEKTNFAMKYEIQEHNGNIYPGSNYANLPQKLEGERHVVQFSGDRIFRDKLLAEVTWRYEDDKSGGVEWEVDDEEEEDIDEDIEDLLEEDSDFNYLKHQLGISFIYRLSNRLSLLSFTAVHHKRFKDWDIEGEHSRRRDYTAYQSTILQFKPANVWSIDLKYIIEYRQSNLNTVDYVGQSIVLGISLFK
ncbi:hypothetical protein ACFL45_02610 [Candidatus Neomarinimicrobiota bacterium]